MTANAVDVGLLETGVDELAASLTQLGTEVEELSNVFMPARFTLPDDPPAASRFGAAGARIRGAGGVGEAPHPAHLPPAGRREIRWCSQWSEHAEALARLEELWRS